jgi:hypothetical protein
MRLAREGQASAAVMVIEKPGEALAAQRQATWRPSSTVTLGGAAHTSTTRDGRASEAILRQGYCGLGMRPRA